MQVSVFSHLRATGWSMPLDPRLDSGRTLVLAFGASGLIDAQGAIDDVLAIAMSRVGRRLVLGDRAEEEIEATCDALPRMSRQVGFHSCGDLSPLTGSRCELHDQTMTLTTLAEA